MFLMPAVTTISSVPTFENLRGGLVNNTGSYSLRFLLIDSDLVQLYTQFESIKKERRE
jgi:hypothetical protein